MDHILEFFHSEHYGDILYFDLHMLQDWLLVDPSSNLYTVSTVLFHKYWVANFDVKIYLSTFSMFVPTVDNVKFADDNMVHVQGISIFILI